MTIGWTFSCRTHIIAVAVIGSLSGVARGGPALGDAKQTLGGRPEELVVWLALLAILIALGVYVISKIRPHSAQQEQDTHELMSKFRELHSRGGLSDEEYRTIKSTFTEQLRQQLNDDDGEG